MSVTLTPKHIGHEYVDADEELIAAQMVKEFEAQVSRLYPDRKMLRQVHTKMHGCVKATFQIEAGLPEELKVGVFSKTGSYNAWVRFSNGNTTPQHDKKKDIRGVAIKLLDVGGEKILNDQHSLTTQDFLLISSETFFSKNIKEFSKLITAFTSAGFIKKLLYFLNPLHWIVLVRVNASNIYCDNPVNIPYWSTQPYQFGTVDRAVKYHLKPSPTNQIENENTTDYDYLRTNLAQTLNSNDISFDFYVQFQTDADAMPIEDPTVPWTSEFIKLATLKIPSQIFDSNRQKEFGDNLSFSPWHSLPEHRPLGSFNRIRRRIYEVMSKFRHKENQLPVLEPDDDSGFVTYTFNEKFPATITQKIPAARILHTTAEVIIDGKKEDVFHYISSAAKLPDWLKKSGPIYGVVSVKMLKGQWGKVGDTRKVTRGDNATLVEELISINPYANYAYQTTHFSDIFRFLTNKTYGQCWFDTIDDKTRVRWTYIFTYKNIFARLFLSVFVPIFLKKYLQNGLNNVKAILEGNQ